jgi:hypothetical protein
VTTHWQLKLASLGLSLLLWAVVSAEQVTTQWIPVRVEAVVRDPDYVLTAGPDPVTVRVRFTGRGRELWELALQRPTLVLPVGPVGTARSFILDPGMVDLPAAFRAVQARDVRPAVVRLGLERVASRLVPVHVVLAPGSRQAFALEDSAEATPRSVRVTGPEERIERLEYLPTLPLRLEPGSDGRFSQRVGLDAAELEGLSASASTVRVRGRAERRVERAFASVAVEAPEGMTATPARVEVRLSGPAAVVTGLDPAALVVRVERDSLPARVAPAGVEVAPRVLGVPAGSEARLIPARVRVTSARPAPVVAADSGAALLPAAPPRR